MAMKAAVFLDRDGVINIDHGYVSKIDDFKFIEGSIEAMQILKGKGYLLVVVTNQSGIARGYYSEEDFHNLTEWMDWSLADKGIDLDGIYYCPHHADKGIGNYKVECDCRKPNSGMFESAIADLAIDPNMSFLVGDKLSDIKAGIKAGLKGNYLVNSGNDNYVENIEIVTGLYDDLLSFAKAVAVVN